MASFSNSTHCNAIDLKHKEPDCDWIEKSPFIHLEQLKEAVQMVC